MNWPDLATHRFHDGSLATHGRSKVEWAQIAPRGRVHRIVGVIIRWNFMGGTREKPDVTFVAACGPQRHAIYPKPNACQWERCARCETATTRAGSLPKVTTRPRDVS
jgi:hypothetical protein